MKKFELKNTAREDIEFLLVEIEKSFGIHFKENELADVKTFGELCERIKDKIELENTNDCTTQQAFYKLRSGIADLFDFDAKTISPEDYLSYFFPRNGRRKKIALLEKHLGFKINLLKPPDWIVFVLLIIFLGSFIGLFFNSYFLIGIVVSIIRGKIAFENGIELNVKTLGELAEKITR